MLIQIISIGNVRLSKVLADYVSWRLKNSGSGEKTLSKACDTFFGIINSMTTVSKDQYQLPNLAAELIKDVGFAILSM